MRLLKEMLRNDFSSDNEEEDENDDDVTDYDDEVDDYNDSEDNYNEGDDAENEEKNDVEVQYQSVYGSIIYSLYRDCYGRFAL